MSISANFLFHSPDILGHLWKYYPFWTTPTTINPKAKVRYNWSIYHCQKENTSRKNKDMNKLNFIKCFFTTRITSVWMVFQIQVLETLLFATVKADRKLEDTDYNNLGLSNDLDLYDLFQLSTLSDGAGAVLQWGMRNWVLHTNEAAKILSSLMFLLAGIKMTWRQPSWITGLIHLRGMLCGHQHFFFF